MLWRHGNVELRIWPLDHCPPHVTAICRAGGWTARIEFSMVTDAVSLWDIKPRKNAPTWTVINRLAGQVFDKLPACREAWWQLHKTVCLDNAPAGRHGKGDVVLLPAGTTGEGTVVKGSGVYVPGQGVRARVSWGASTTLEWLKEA